MRKLTGVLCTLVVLGFFILTPLVSTAQIGPVPGGSGGGSSTITSGTTATSGCVAGGVLRSISNLVECGAELTYGTNGLNIGAGTSIAGSQLYLRTAADKNLSVYSGTGSQLVIIGLNNANSSVIQGHFRFSPFTILGGTSGNVEEVSMGYQNDTSPALTLINGAVAKPLLQATYNGVSAFTVGVGGASVFNNGANAVSPLVVQDNGTPVLTVADGGVTTFTQQILAPINVAGFAFGSGYEAYGIGLASASNRIQHMINGNVFAAVSSTNGFEVSTDGITFFSSTVNAGSADTRLQREAAATLQIGVDVNGAAVNQTFKAHDGITGTDISGANLTIAAGRGTGAGAGGTVIFQTAPVGSTGTTAQTLATVLTLPKSGGLQVATGTKPTCEAATRGTLYYVAGGAGVADTYEACRKDASDAYAWTAIY